jgi:guanosine-3',5'-bis(diphosphate) 3'-pyrophosphohydrolase
MDYPENIGILFKAFRFSASKHRNQRRRDTVKSPYINHPIEVAELLWDVGGVRDMNVLLAAILHDTLEDTNTGPEEIRDAFGEGVLSIVLEVTDDKSLPKLKRKRVQIETASQKSTNAKLIRLADKSCNIRDLNNTPPRNWNHKRRSEYLLWTEQVVAGLRGTNAALEEYYDNELARGKQVLGIEP